MTNGRSGQSKGLAAAPGNPWYRPSSLSDLVELFWIGPSRMRDTTGHSGAAKSQCAGIVHQIPRDSPYSACRPDGGDVFAATRASWGFLAPKQRSASPRPSNAAV